MRAFLTNRLAKRLGIALALSSLVIRLVVALVSMPAMMASDASAVALGEGQFKLVYCSLLGKMAVPGSSTIDPDAPDNVPPGPEQGGCSLCQAIGASGCAASPDGYGLAPVVLASMPPVVDQGRVVVSRRPLRATARGPPVLHT